MSTSRHRRQVYTFNSHVRLGRMSQMIKVIDNHVGKNDESSEVDNERG